MEFSGIQNGTGAFNFSSLVQFFFHFLSFWMQSKLSAQFFWSGEEENTIHGAIELKIQLYDIQLIIIKRFCWLNVFQANHIFRMQKVWARIEGVSFYRSIRIQKRKKKQKTISIHSKKESQLMDISRNSQKTNSIGK